MLLISGFVKEEILGVKNEFRSMAMEQRRELGDNFGKLMELTTNKIIELANLQKDQLDSFSKNLSNLTNTLNEQLIKMQHMFDEGFNRVHQNVNQSLKNLGDTNTNALTEMGKHQREQLDIFSTNLKEQTTMVNNQLNSMKKTFDEGFEKVRIEVSQSLKTLADINVTSLTNMGNDQKSQLEQIVQNMGKLTETLDGRFDSLKKIVDERLDKIRDDNAKQLEQMRQTVDEKLQGTLEKRLGESFKLVSERLELVHKGLGEMQALATNVGDLKKVLGNVKSRGILGEIQLENMLEQVLVPEQYGKDVSVKNNNERVEFAIKLPGKGEDRNEVVWLPIDAKFPMEDYSKLVASTENGNLADIELYGKQLEMKIKQFAKDIYTKYINPPITTDFAVLYLPVEGLFAEVARRNTLISDIQRDCKVVIAGPTTLWSILNSLQMGFRTLAIQKRSSEVWNLLGAVKTEWGKFGDMLGKVKVRLEQATSTIEDAQRRSNIIQKKLSKVQEIPVEDAEVMLMEGEEV
jgi:DNA recombination protein RmuC